MSFLQDILIEDLGQIRIHFHQSPVEIFDRKLDIFTMDKKNLSIEEFKELFLKALSNSNLNKEKQVSLFNNCVKYQEDILNLGFIIISLRKDFSKYSDRVLSYLEKNHSHAKIVVKELQQFIDTKLSPKHFTRGLNGSRNIIYKLDLPESLNLSIGIRKRLSKIEKHRILEKHPDFEFRDDLPQFTYQQQMKTQEELHKLSEADRGKNPGIARVPFPFYADENDHYQIMEFVESPTLIDYRLKNSIHPQDSRRLEIEKRLNSTFDFWKNHLFVHRDFHSRNVLINPDTLDLVAIDFDLSKFCQDEEEFNSPYQIQIGNKTFTAERDRDIRY